MDAAVASVDDPQIVDLGLVADGALSRERREAVVDITGVQLEQMHRLPEQLLSERLTLY